MRGDIVHRIERAGEDSFGKNHMGLPILKAKMEYGMTEK